MIFLFTSFIFWLIPQTVEHPVSLCESNWDQDIFFLSSRLRNHIYIYIYIFSGQRNLSARRCAEFVHRSALRNMDGLLKAFWPLTTGSGPAGVIPTYRQGDAEDTIDLQIKSLCYIFRRCNIAESQAFPSDATVGGVGVAGAGGSDKYREQAKLQRERIGNAPTRSPGVRGRLGTLDKKFSMNELKSASSVAYFPPKAVTGSTAKSSAPLDGSEQLGVSAMDNEKLDILYSKCEFDKLMKSDEHRVLIDWKKNKFRSMCLLSGKPSEGTSLPPFPMKNYKFSLLPAKSSEVGYITILSDSNLYIEHYVPKETRRQLAKEALDLVKEITPATADFTKNDRALVILTYLRRLSVEVQVDRLYKSLYRERIKVENRPNDPLSIPERSVPKITAKTAAVSTPTKPLTASPYTSLMASPKTPKYYIKAKGDTNIPFSHRGGNTQKSPQPLALVSPPQMVQTTKPRPSSNSKDAMLSPPQSRGNSPVRASSRASDFVSPGLPTLRKKGSAISLGKSGPALSSPSRVTVSKSSKAVPPSSNGTGRKLSGPSPQGSPIRTISRVGSSSGKTSPETPNANDQIRQEVMAQTRAAVQTRLERERLLIEAENN